MTILFCSAETVDARPTQIWLKDTSIRSSTAVEISDLNSQTHSIVEILCLTNSFNHVTYSAIVLT